MSGGTYSGDVNLFNGTYSSTQPLGSVSTPSGLSFTLNMNYNSVGMGGDNVPVTKGIPYGEGWDVSIPKITVKNVTYKKIW